MKVMKSLGGQESFPKKNKMFASVCDFLRKRISALTRSAYRNFPLSVEKKLAYKARLFSRVPWLFQRTEAYRAWRASASPYVSALRDEPGELELQEMFLAEQHFFPVPRLETPPLEAPPVRLLAFYLPQFHPIPENDSWWGAGFTEWTNVRRGVAQFKGHQQPHIPGELGYYDLRNPEVLQRQVELAELYGIGGFCFYFYWFAGKRLLELPIKMYAENRNLKLPFCLCWANENWSRRWDGLENEILIGQRHSAADDIDFIQHISHYFADPRYVRIQGKPLLIVYRPSLLPAALKTAKRWREWCRKNGIGEIYLAYTQSFESVHPQKYGFDGAIEFPPNNTSPPIITDKIGLTHPNFNGIVYDWTVFEKRSRDYPLPHYPLFRGVCPGWDNTARRGHNGAIFVGATPEKYQRWLENAASDVIQRSADPDERIVFVNAWNEWAEGAHLEPDELHGYAYLQATRDALERVSAQRSARRILLVAHDAHPHGAQSLILHVAKVLKEDFDFMVDMVVLGDGPLLTDYGKYATVHRLPGNTGFGGEANALVAKLFGLGIRSAIANTTVSGIFAALLKKGGFHVVSLIHELPKVIAQHGLEAHARAIATSADTIIFPAQTVLDSFCQIDVAARKKSIIRPQGLYKKNSLQGASALKKARRDLRVKFALPPEAVIVLGVGYADHRKGIDLFVEMGQRLIETNNNVYLFWVGLFDASLEPTIRARIAAAGHCRHFIFPGLDFQTDTYYAGADIYALTSREDPFPSVVMEALDVGVPVVAFAGAGGSGELLSRAGGILVPAFDSQGYADAIAGLLASPDERERLGAAGREIVNRELSFRHYIYDLLSAAKLPIKRISVVIPNYNYKKFLRNRITSVLSQNYPIYEVIILDDASTDGSLELIDELVTTMQVDCRILVNTANSGSPFGQWLNGVEHAKGDYVWIAEADDLAEPTFLAEVIKPFADQKVVMSYCQSKQMSAAGRIIASDYLDYLADVSTEKWKSYYVEDGVDEIRCSLAIKNTIPNASGVVFSREVIYKSLKDNIEEIKGYRVAGDWVTYLQVLQHGHIAYSPRPLNLHRRHENSVTIGSFNISQLKEILAVQKKVRGQFVVSEAITMKARGYSSRLYVEFGLNGGGFTCLENHPELVPYLEP